MKVGFILECATGGPDAHIYPYVFNKFCDGHEFEKPDTLVNKKILLEECHTRAEILLDTCQYVFIIWDRKPGNCEDDKGAINANLTSLGLPLNRIHLCCIDEELESWMITDGNAVTDHFQSFTNHRLPTFKDHKSPADQSHAHQKIKNTYSRYNKFKDNFGIVKRMNLDKPTKSNESFAEFRGFVEAICP